MMLDAELEPVADAELLLRRVPTTRVFDEDKSGRVARTAFLPRCCERSDNDVDGVSVFRERFTTPLECRNAALHNLQNKSIVRFGAAAVRRFRSSSLHEALDVHPDPLPSGPRGHSLIRQLRCSMLKDHEAAVWAASDWLALASTTVPV
jgi:hypothetical protein